MTRKTTNKWDTDNCPSCGGKHEKYTGKLDKDGQEYVVCGSTHKRCNVIYLFGGVNPSWKKHCDHVNYSYHSHGREKICNDCNERID
jgi:hypothetical protein